MKHQADTQATATHEQALLERLRALYAARTPLPESATAMFTIYDYYRLCRHIMEEGYGR